MSPTSSIGSSSYMSDFPSDDASRCDLSDYGADVWGLSGLGTGIEQYCCALEDPDALPSDLQGLADTLVNNFLAVPYFPHKLVRTLEELRDTAYLSSADTFIAKGTAKDVKELLNYTCYLAQSQLERVGNGSRDNPIATPGAVLEDCLSDLAQLGVEVDDDVYLCATAGAIIGLLQNMGGAEVLQPEVLQKLEEAVIPGETRASTTASTRVELCRRLSSFIVLQDTHAIDLDLDLADLSAASDCPSQTDSIAVGASGQGCHPEEGATALTFLERLRRDFVRSRMRAHMNRTEKLVRGEEHS